MSLQKNIIKKYRQLYPTDTLREVSARTGIQITRVFRLFNGKPMKVGELEAFQSVIDKKLGENPESHRLQRILEEAMFILTTTELSKLNSLIERKVSNKNVSRLYVSPNFENAIA
jgi:hypothetical protein